MYDIKEVELTNQSITKKRLVITFHDEEMAIVGEFLMTDAPLMDGNVLEKLANVIDGKKQKAEFTGQRCHLTIKKNKTLIEDLFYLEEITLYAPLSICTKELYNLTKMWLGKLAEQEL